MDDESPRRGKERPSPAKMSKTPSWIMLGFVLGALFVVALPQRKPVPAPAPRPLEFTKPAPPREAQPLSTIEAVFEEWGGYAVWFDDTTEVALWNSTYRDFTDCYEVRRIGNMYYFRTIPALTRRTFAHGQIPPDCPLRFTETEEQYREWLERGRIDRPAERRLRPAADQPRHPAVDTTMPRMVPPEVSRGLPPTADK